MHRTLPLAVALIALAAGCGGSSSGSRQAATAAPIGSAAPVTSALAFRALDRGDATGLPAGPGGGFAAHEAGDDVAWQALWAQHGAAGARPAVDLAQERVAALVLGDRATAGWGIEVVGLAEVGSGTLAAVEVQYRRQAPTGAVAPGATRPVHVVAVNRPQATLSFVDVTPAASVAPVTSLHGTLVAAPTHLGATTLAFLPDGARDALELADPSALVAAGAVEGDSLLASGDRRANAGGRTALAEALALAGFALDEVVLSGRVATGFPGAAFVVGQQAYDAQGPLAAALLAHPVDRPVRVWGRIDPNAQSQVGRLLHVHAWRPAVELSLASTRPLLGHDRFDVLDLEGAGGWALDAFELVGRTPEVRKATGRSLDAAVLADLRARLAAADLRNQPSTFQPTPIYPGHPTESLRFADAQGEVTVTIWGGAAVPAEVADLVQALRAASGLVPALRPLEVGDQSQIAAPEVTLARDAGAWAGLWGRHVGGRPLPPDVDFRRDLALGVFDGQRPSGGFAIEVAALEQVGRTLRVTTRRTAPTGPAPSVITTPYAFAVLEHAAALDVQVDGRRP